MKRNLPPSGNFTQIASIRNSASDYTILDPAALYCLPHAILRVTPRWNPPGSASVYNNHNVGVFYISGSGR